MLPRPRLNYSMLNKLELLKTHIMGSINFGRKIVCYIDFNEIGHDSNLNINVMLRVINYI